MSAWGKAPWAQIGQSNASSHDVLVERLAPCAGERWLDVGTGTGGVALRAARAGAVVTGLDIAPEAIDEARRLAAEEGLDVRFDVGDAQTLAYGESEFDVVSSAFGVNFAPDHVAAARELARVCRPGGRLGLTLMPPESRTAELWTLIRRYGDAQGDHPAEWAREERASELLGASFELELESREGPPDPPRESEEVWEFMRESFGPLKDVVERLGEEDAAALRAEFLALRARYEGRPPAYVLLLGRRR